MIQVTNISDDAHQKTTVLLADNSSVVITLDYRPRTQGWVMSVIHGVFTRKCVPLCIHPNLLRSERAIIPLGIACVSNDGVDPFDINDFSNDRVKLYVLDNTGNETDVDMIENNIYQSGL